MKDTRMPSQEMGRKKSQERIEKLVEGVFFLSATFSVISVFLIAFFIFLRGTPAIVEIGPINFLFGMQWKPSANLFGIFPMILASLYGTLGAIILGVPIGVLTAIFIAELSPPWLKNIIKPAVELLAGIPSVIYGFFGLIVFIPMIDDAFGGGGNSLLAVIFILSIMILPTIITISETALNGVPKEYREGSYALGASKIQTIFKVVVPAAKSGILTAIVLGIGRAVGETMAVILVAGNSAMMPSALTDRVRTLTANIAIEMGYAFGLHQEALFATGVVLLIFIMLLNVILTFVVRKAGD